MSFAINRPDHVDAEVWSDFVTLRKAKKAPVTNTVIRGFEREAAKAGISLQQAIEVACEMGWQGFRADWYAKRNPVQSYAQADAQRKQSRFAAFTGATAQPLQFVETVTRELSHESVHDRD